MQKLDKKWIGCSGSLCIPLNVVSEVNLYCLLTSVRVAGALETLTES